jgi:hypothetical protein
MKGKKAEDDDIAIAMERLANARLQANEDRKIARNLDKEAMDVMEARRAALEERLATNEERKLALEKKKQANEKHLRLVEEERKLFLMDTFHMDERQKEYINLARDEVLAKKRLLKANMNTPTAGMFGGGMGGMPIFGGGMGRHGRYGRHARHGRNDRHGRLWRHGWHGRTKLWRSLRMGLWEHR